MIRILLKRLNDLEQDISELEAKIAMIRPLERHLLSSIPGVKTVMAAKLLVEIRDSNQFRNSGALARCAGVASRNWSSAGKGRPRRSKRGNVQLNTALYILALKQITHVPEAEAYYRRKFANGKTKMLAIASLMTHLCRLI